MKLHLWKSLLWNVDSVTQTPFALCPEHRIQLEVLTDYDLESQESVSTTPQHHFACPIDEKTFPLDIDIWTMQRRFRATLDSLHLKNADIVSLDGYQIPIAKVDAPKDENYWVQARINDTKQGKQLVVYAGKRGAGDKAQMFIDIPNDKITFDQNNMHPNDVFARVVANFRSGRRATLESPEQPQISSD